MNSNECFWDDVQEPVSVLNQESAINQTHQQAQSSLEEREDARDGALQVVRLQTECSFQVIWDSPLVEVSKVNYDCWHDDFRVRATGVAKLQSS